MTGLIKKKIINKYNYIQKTSKVKKELESIEIPVCPSSSLSSSMKITPFVWAGWSPSTKMARTNGLLEYDKSRRKWLIFKERYPPSPLSNNTLFISPINCVYLIKFDYVLRADLELPSCCRG